MLSNLSASVSTTSPRRCHRQSWAELKWLKMVWVRPQQRTGAALFPNRTRCICEHWSFCWHTVWQCTKAKWWMLSLPFSYRLFYSASTLHIIQEICPLGSLILFFLYYLFPSFPPPLLSLFSFSVSLLLFFFSLFLTVHTFDILQHLGVRLLVDSGRQQSTGVALLLIQFFCFQSWGKK